LQAPDAAQIRPFSSSAASSTYRLTRLVANPGQRSAATIHLDCLGSPSSISTDISWVNPLTAQGYRVDQQVRDGDDVEPAGSHALPDRVRELVVMSQHMKARPHGPQPLIEHRLPGIDPASRRIERSRRFMSQEDVDAGE